jgi:hypothetical protein
MLWRYMPYISYAGLRAGWYNAYEAPGQVILVNEVYKDDEAKIGHIGQACRYCSWTVTTTCAWCPSRD